MASFRFGIRLLEVIAKMLDLLGVASTIRFDGHDYDSGACCGMIAVSKQDKKIWSFFFTLNSQYSGTGIKCLERFQKNAAVALRI